MRILILLLFFVAGCNQAESQQAPANPSVWAVDFIQTLPGQQDNYVRSIETNWAHARSIARQRGAVLSYQALVSPQDSLRGWDVMLLTEYTDSTAFANREPTFQEIFASDDYVRVEPPVPSSEMRVFFGETLAMRSFVNQ